MDPDLRSHLEEMEARMFGNEMEAQFERLDERLDKFETRLLAFFATPICPVKIQQGSLFYVEERLTLLEERVSRIEQARKAKTADLRTNEQGKYRTTDPQI